MDTRKSASVRAGAPISTGAPVELGLSISRGEEEPCAVVPPATSLIVGGAPTNNTCSAYFSYSRNQRIRTSTPTERLSLRSSNFQRLDLIASYSAAVPPA